jgi:hypothetical protein
MSFTIKHAYAISRVRTTQYRIRTMCIVRAGKEMPNADAMALSGRVGALGVGALRRAQLEHHVRTAARSHPGHPPPSNKHGVSRVRTTQYSIRTACIVCACKELPNADTMALSGRVGAMGVKALRRAQLEHHVRSAARVHPGHPPPSNKHTVSRVRTTQ